MTIRFNYHSQTWSEVDINNHGSNHLFERVQQFTIMKDSNFVEKNSNSVEQDLFQFSYDWTFIKSRPAIVSHNLRGFTSSFFWRKEHKWKYNLSWSINSHTYYKFNLRWQAIHYHHFIISSFYQKLKFASTNSNTKAQYPTMKQERRRYIYT